MINILKFISTWFEHYDRECALIQFTNLFQFYNIFKVTIIRGRRRPNKQALIINMQFFLVVDRNVFKREFGEKVACSYVGYCRDQESKDFGSKRETLVSNCALKFMIYCSLPYFFPFTLLALPP